MPRRVQFSRERERDERDLLRNQLKAIKMIHNLLYGYVQCMRMFEFVDIKRL